MSASELQRYAIFDKKSVYSRSMSQILDTINNPLDIKKLNMNQLRQLCSEIRSYMVEVCSDNPGHLASSLGAVELIVGVHYVFDTPEDKFVIDVGHQAYAHKILTGRREAFRTLRKKDGISGFPCIDESIWDAFGVGHSSTSISAALGFAEAARIKGTGAKSVALIGDGALSGGLAYEAMNNAGVSKSDLLILLNDNNQSIDKAVGGVHKYLLRITTSVNYNIFKNRAWKVLGDNRFRSFLQRWVRSIKSWLVKSRGGDLFEAIGLRYFGPIDGNDIEQVVQTLRKLKDMKGARVLHCITGKGKGYAPAEQNPTLWHAPGRFDLQTGQIKVVKHDVPRYQDVFGKVLCEMAESDPRVVGITPAMSSGCSMVEFSQRFPSRFFDVGIAEEHAVTFSAGLAASGMKPFCNIYSSFSQRAYDQIVHDVALQKLPVVLCLDRAGLVGEDGATHNGAFDMAAYRSIPNCVIAVPSNESELKNMMYSAKESTTGPYIIRYPRGLAEGVEWQAKAPILLPVGKSVCVREGKRIAVVGLGPFVWRAVEAARPFGEDVAVYDFRFLKPIDTERLDEIVSQFETILTIEDGCLKGGLYGAVCEYIETNSCSIKVKGIGIPDEFIFHASQAEQRHFCGLDKEGIENVLRKLL